MQRLLMPVLCLSIIQVQYIQGMELEQSKITTRQRRASSTAAAMIADKDITAFETYITQHIVYQNNDTIKQKLEGLKQLYTDTLFNYYINSVTAKDISDQAQTFELTYYGIYALALKQVIKTILNKYKLTDLSQTVQSW